jgi:hypothetical protein
LIDKGGCDPNEVDGEGCFSGLSLLQLGCRHGQESVVNVLLEKGADVRSIDVLSEMKACMWVVAEQHKMVRTSMGQTRESHQAKLASKAEVTQLKEMKKEEALEADELDDALLQMSLKLTASRNEQQSERERLEKELQEASKLLKISESEQLDSLDDIAGLQAQCASAVQEANREREERRELESASQKEIANSKAMHAALLRRRRVETQREMEKILLEAQAL